MRYLVVLVLVLGLVGCKVTVQERDNYTINALDGIATYQQDVIADTATRGAALEAELTQLEADLNAETDLSHAQVLLYIARLSDQISELRAFNASLADDLDAQLQEITALRFYEDQKRNEDDARRDATND